MGQVVSQGLHHGQLEDAKAMPLSNLTLLSQVAPKFSKKSQVSRSCYNISYYDAHAKKKKTLRRDLNPPALCASADHGHESNVKLPLDSDQPSKPGKTMNLLEGVCQ